MAEACSSHSYCPGPSAPTSRSPGHDDEPHLAVEEDGDNSPVNLATAERVGSPAPRSSTVLSSPVAGTSTATGFRAPTTLISSGPHGLNLDAETYDVDGDV